MEESRTGSCSLLLLAECLSFSSFASLFGSPPSFSLPICTLATPYKLCLGRIHALQRAGIGPKADSPASPGSCSPCRALGWHPDTCGAAHYIQQRVKGGSPGDSFRLLSGRLGPGFLPSSASPQRSAPKSGPGGCAAAAAATLLFPWKHGEGWLGCHAASAGAGAQGVRRGMQGMKGPCSVERNEASTLQLKSTSWQAGAGVLGDALILPHLAKAQRSTWPVRERQKGAEGSQCLTACVLLLINCSLVSLPRGLPATLPAPRPAARA